MSLLGAIQTFKTGTYAVVRPGATTFDANGRAVPGSPAASFNIDASVQPLTGNQMKTIPEDRRTEDWKMIYTATELRADAAAPDIVTISGEPWMVWRVAKWENGTRTTHYEATCARQVIR